VIYTNAGVNLILHGLWHDAALHVWADVGQADAGGAAAPPTSGANDDEDHGEPRDHPFAGALARLHEIIGDLTPDGLLATSTAEKMLTLRLPQVDGLPIRHSGGLAAQPSNQTTVTDSVSTASKSILAATSELPFGEFRVPALRFEPADAMDLLDSLPDPPARVWGGSMIFWQRVAQFVRRVLERGQFVPDLLQLGGETAPSIGTWRVRLRDVDVLARLEQLVGRMPGVCMAIRTGDRGNAAEPHRLVEDFVQRCGDALIRRHLNQDSFFQRVCERASPDASPEIHWLASLVGDRPVVGVAGEALSELNNQVRGWLSRVDDVRDAPPPTLHLELCEPDLDDDTIEAALSDHKEIDTDAPQADGDADSAPRDDTSPPPADSPRWVLRFGLEAPDGTGRVHDADSILSDPQAPLRILQPAAVNLREHLLGELHRVSGVYPPIGAALRRERPTHMDLTTVEAHSFLRDAAPLLEMEGVRLELPQWARRPTSMLGLRLNVRPAFSTGLADGESGAGVSSLGLQSIVEFEWQVAVGDRNLTPAQFEALRSSNQPLVRFDGEWIDLDLNRADQAARFLESRREGRMTLLEALRMTAGAGDELPDVPVVGLSGADWIERLLDESPTHSINPIEQPTTLAGDLRPYQLRGLSWLKFMDRLGIGSCLADDMGLGKTIQLISLLLCDQAEAQEAKTQNAQAERIASQHVEDESTANGPTLVFAPTSVVGNWQREIERFAPSLRSLIHHGPQRLSGDGFVRATQNVDVVITTYALGHRDLEMLQQIRWRRIVLDEAQKIKNPSAAQTIAIRSLAAPRWIAMTGTPLENHLSELWSIMEMINRGLLGSAAGFRKRFAVPIERFRDQAKADQLRRMIRPFLLRRIKSDPQVDCDLPEKMEMKVFCNLTAEQASMYEKIVNETLGEVESASGIRRRGIILAALTRLKQACNHPLNMLDDGSPLPGRSGKCDRLIEMLEEVIAEGDAALVFTQFRKMGDLLERMIRERFRIELPFLHGGVPGGRRQALVDGFQSGGENNPVMLLSLRAGGLGLNLTRANHVFHFDRWWNPAVEEQATDRAHRIGQMRKVQVHKFICIGTIEDRIDRLLTEKVALADKIVGSGDEWITGLSTEQLREYLTLARDAIG